MRMRTGLMSPISQTSWRNASVLPNLIVVARLGTTVPENGRETWNNNTVFEVVAFLRLPVTTQLQDQYSHCHALSERSVVTEHHKLVRTMGHRRPASNTVNAMGVPEHSIY